MMCVELGVRDPILAARFALAILAVLAALLARLCRYFIRMVDARTPASVSGRIGRFLDIALLAALEGALWGAVAGLLLTAAWWER